MSSSEHVLDATTCHTHTPRHLCQHNRRAIVKAHAVRSSANAHQIGVREGRNRVRKLRTGGNHDERGRCHESAMQFAAFLLAESASRVVQACERATQQPRDARSRALARCDARCIHFMHSQNSPCNGLFSLGENHRNNLCILPSQQLYAAVETSAVTVAYFSAKKSLFPAHFEDK